MIEVERKYRIKTKSKIEKALIVGGFFPGKAKRQIDQIYLLKSDSFKTFKSGDPVVRIRTVNGFSWLTHKRTINSVGDTVEHEITIDPAQEANKMLLEMGYKPVTKVDKIRKEYILGKITVAIDKVKLLGSFVEIEVVCTEKQRDAALVSILETAQKLGLSETDIEKTKYDQLISALNKK